MNISDESKQNVLNNLLRDVWHVSNKEYQRRIWIEGRGPECDDYDETSIGILDDGEVVIKEPKHLEMTDEQYCILKAFWNAYEQFSHGIGMEYYIPERFIDTEEWTRVTEMAKEVIKAFDYCYKHRS